MEEKIPMKILPLLIATTVTCQADPWIDNFKATALKQDTECFYIGAETAALIAAKAQMWVNGKSVGDVANASSNIYVDTRLGMSLDQALAKECPNPSTNIMFLTPITGTNWFTNGPVNFAVTNALCGLKTNWLGCPITGDYNNFSLPTIVEGWHPEYELGLKPDGTVVWRLHSN